MKVRAVYYIVENDDTFYRMSQKMYARIAEQHQDERHPEFAGRRVRYARIDVVVDGSTAIGVARATFHSMKFDDAGMLDVDDVLEQQGLAVELLGHPDDLKHPGERERRRERVNKEFDFRFGWRPPDWLRDSLYAAALANKRSSGRAAN